MTARARTTPTVTTPITASSTSVAAPHPQDGRSAAQRGGRFGRVLDTTHEPPASRTATPKATDPATATSTSALTTHAAPAPATALSTGPQGPGTTPAPGTTPSPGTGPTDPTLPADDAARTSATVEVGVTSSTTATAGPTADVTAKDDQSADDQSADDRAVADQSIADQVTAQAAAAAAAAASPAAALIVAAASGAVPPVPAAGTVSSEPIPVTATGPGAGPGEPPTGRTTLGARAAGARPSAPATAAPTASAGAPLTVADGTTGRVAPDGVGRLGPKGAPSIPAASTVAGVGPGIATSRPADATPVTAAAAPEPTASGRAVAELAIDGRGVPTAAGPSSPGTGTATSTAGALPVGAGLTATVAAGPNATLAATLSADQVTSVPADRTGDLSAVANPAAAAPSPQSGVPVSATTSWFGFDLTTTTAAGPDHPAVPGHRARDGASAVTSSSPTALPAQPPIVTAPGGGTASAGDAGRSSGTGGDAASDTPQAGDGPVAGANPSVATAQTPAITTDRAGGATAPASVGEQVARQISAVRTTADGTHRTVVRLDPEHLGPITLTVSVRAGRVRLAVTGSPEAMAALDASMGSLHDSLGSAGLGLDGVSLQPTTATGSSSSSTDGRSGQSAASFAATADAAGDGGRRAPEGRGGAADLGADRETARRLAGSATTDPATTPQPLSRNGLGVAGGVDVRI